MNFIKLQETKTDEIFFPGYIYKNNNNDILYLYTMTGQFIRLDTGHVCDFSHISKNLIDKPLNYLENIIMVLKITENIQDSMLTTTNNIYILNIGEIWYCPNLENTERTFILADDYNLYDLKTGERRTLEGWEDYQIILKHVTFEEVS